MDSCSSISCISSPKEYIFQARISFEQVEPSVFTRRRTLAGMGASVKSAKNAAMSRFQAARDQAKRRKRAERANAANSCNGSGGVNHLQTFINPIFYQPQGSSMVSVFF